MITVKSNINEFLKNYRKRVGNFKSTLNVFAKKLAERMSADMAYEIARTRHIWTEEGNLDKVSGVDFSITNIGDNAVRVSIGENLEKFEMKDGTLVNPIYFIEFGFGIAGQKNPQDEHSKFGWEYNIRGHKGAWYYYDRTISPPEGADDKWKPQMLRSEGRQGSNFMYNVIETYKTNWQQYLKELMTEIGNG